MGMSYEICKYKYYICEKTKLSQASFSQSIWVYWHTLEEFSEFRCDSCDFTFMVRIYYMEIGS